MSRALFLDRDGILNKVVKRGDTVSSPWHISEFELINDAKALVALAKKQDFLTVVVTNQPDVAKGNIPAEQLELMHKKIAVELEVDEIKVCTSVDATDPRHKPNPGMLLEAGSQLGIDLENSFFLGDSDKGLLAGARAGVKTILLQTDYNLPIHGSGYFNCNTLDEVKQIVKPTFAKTYLSQATQIIEAIDPLHVEKMVHVLRRSRDRGGRLFLLGSGGGAGHASHATCDFRKLCGFEAYCPTDNISELTARINDDGWDSSLANYLKGSKLRKEDCLFIFSVGGGSEERKISNNLVQSVKLANEVGASVVGVVGRDGGYTAAHADAAVIVPTVDSALITPHTESFQALIWHLIISHPLLQIHQTKWESAVK